MIASTLNVSIEKVRRLSKMPEVPIYKHEGGYFAFHSELMTWLRTKT